MMQEETITLQMDSETSSKLLDIYWNWLRINQLQGVNDEPWTDTVLRGLIDQEHSRLSTQKQ